MSVAWFERAGFEVDLHDDIDAFAHRERGLTIHLAKTVDEETAGGGAVYLRCQDRGSGGRGMGPSTRIIVSGPRDEDYGNREGSASDAEGNVIRFGGPIR